MEIIEIDENNNQILGNKPNLSNSSINFKGKNNRLVCEENVTLANCKLNFSGNNSIIYLSSNRHVYRMDVSIYNNSVCFFDENNYMNGKMHLILSEEKHIFMGKDGLYSFGIWMRLADPHLIYDCTTKHRINLSKSIFIGDHVWIGQDALILKGNRIGSGSIIGARSVVSNKKISSNTSWAGNPPKQVAENIFYDSSSVHMYTEEQTKNSLTYSNDNWIYKNEGEILNFDDIDSFLSNCKNVDDKIGYLLIIRQNNSHNRFYIE